MKNLKMLLPMFLLVFTAASINAQKAPPAPVDAAEKLKGLEFMIGEWEGEGWIQIGRERKTFTARESLTPRLNGTILVVEGLGKSVDEATGNERVVHQAYGIFYYDHASDKVVFRFFKADGPAGLAEPVFSDKKVEWGFIAEPTKSKVRFIEELDEDGNWVEKGEVKIQGRDEWFQFFFMKLTKLP